MTELSNHDWSISQGEAAGPQLHRILREQIVRGDLAPGVRISEAEIAQRFGLSRQPVRETFIKLSEEKLVEVRPQRGTFVKKIEVQAVVQGRFVREAVEADIVRQAAELARPEDIARLKELIEAQHRVQDDSDAFIVLDEQFHRAIAAIADKEYAWSLVQGLKTQMDRVRHISARQFHIGKLVIQHAAIAKAISERDADAAEKAMRGHLREVLRDLPQVAAARPEFFDGTFG
ncbi:GntR family transcriptional regulator [Rhodovulum sp. DZ06]|uniref:GntR family transcriptional regulator n=1 Tax=Rhodovulum sp. DZ06 TaxID=3425126 RepID=UPI003D347970